MVISGAVQNRGYVQVYTGDGKGKTTAAIGLAIRAIGAGFKVYIAQFMKNGGSSEIEVLKLFADRIKIEHFGGKKEQMPAGGQQALGAWSERVQEIFDSRKYQIVVLEEANMAATYSLLSIDDLLQIITLKPDPIELVITGRYAHPRVIERADLVTEMKEIKHYFRSGVVARIGIEM